MTPEKWQRIARDVVDLYEEAAGVHKLADSLSHERCKSAFDLGAYLYENVYRSYGVGGLHWLGSTTGIIEDTHYRYVMIYWGAMRRRSVVDECPGVPRSHYEHLGMEFRGHTDLLTFCVQYNFIYNPGPWDGCWVAPEEFSRVPEALRAVQSRIRNDLAVGYIIDNVETDIVDGYPIVRCPPARPGDEDEVYQTYTAIHDFFVQLSDITEDDGIYLPAGLWRLLHPVCPDMSFAKHRPQYELV